MRKIATYASIGSFAFVFLNALYFFYNYYNRLDEIPADDDIIAKFFLFAMLLNFGLVIYSISLTSRHEKIIADKQEFVDREKELKKIIDYYKQSLNIHSTTNHNISHSLRQLLNDCYEAIVKTEFERYLEINAKFFQFLQFLTTNVKENFDVLTKNACSVYVLLVEEDEQNDDNYLVNTLFRDPISYPKRDLIDKDFDNFYYANQFFPLTQILDEGNNVNHFVCDDCITHKSFYDRIQDWHDYYKSMLCVPIRKYIGIEEEDGERVDYYRTIGFLVVDNFEGNLDNKIAIEQLKGYADQLYHLFIIFTHLEKLFYETQNDKLQGTSEQSN
ncbi:hypothetical protein IMCC3317_22210 [Kordia antarctica]|uniref:Uncharacterized protein n=1 Tax=Kordia antarctica TaxID=1218801 RepID=A0A7L4ZK14_9FLAO|nr:hypothetical protein [Kordia antarctica]QHI36851.1 hypothetical protein IMCC3317_22210 [Kordia antarctica]